MVELPHMNFQVRGIWVIDARAEAFHDAPRAVGAFQPLVKQALESSGRDSGMVQQGQDLPTWGSDGSSLRGEFPVILLGPPRSGLAAGKTGRVKDHQTKTVTAFVQAVQPLEHVPV